MIDNPIISYLNTSGVFILFALVLAYLLFVEKRKKHALSVAISAIVAGFVALILKGFFAEPRPFLVSDPQAAAGLAFFSSFPSFHASFAFATATSVAYHKKWFGVLLLVLASVIGIGRVMANVHYPIDVAFGVLVGVFIASAFESV